MKRNIVIVICLVLGFCSLFIGTFAYYKIVVYGSIGFTTGNVVFDLKDSSGESLNDKVINLNNGNKINPGDSGSFNVVFDASGSKFSMYATLEIDRGNLPTNLKFYTSSDKKSELHKYYSFLEKGKTSRETLTIYWYWNPYISDEEDSKFINVDSFSCNITVSAVQINEYATMKNGSVLEGDSINGTEFWNKKYVGYISSVNFGHNLDDMPSSCTEENLCWDITDEGSKEKVYGYLVDNGLKDIMVSTQALYDLYIVSEVPIFAPSNCSFMFAFFMMDEDAQIMGFNLKSINFNNNFNTSNAVNMYGMFYGDMILKSLDLDVFNTLNVISMENMFLLCPSLIELDLSNFNTINVTDMRSMFYNCSTLTKLDLSNFNTTNVTDMRNMFGKCLALTKLDLSNFNTTNVTDMGYMFYECSALAELDLSNFNTTNVIYMRSMFYNCSTLTKLDLSNFNTTNVTDMGYMFNKCSALAELDLSNFNTTNVTDMYAMFELCSNIKTSFNIMSNSITNYEYMFYNTSTNEGSSIIVNYIADASTLVDNMILTKTSNSNVVKGSVI